MNPKIAIYYDSMVSIGGGERVVIELANILNADIITSGFDSKINEWIHINNRVIDIGNLSIRLIKPIGTLFESPLRFYLSRNRFKYDINIFIGFTSIFASNNHNINIWYCLTPNRVLYDLREFKLKDQNFIKRILFKLHIILFYKLDHSFIKNNFCKILTQSLNVRKRVKKYYDIESSVIYSPINTKNYKFKRFGDYFLTVSRLYADKRIDLIVKSFIKIPDKKLVIVGNGPEKRKIENLIKGHPNISLLSNINDDELNELYANCLATIFMARNEDYGLIPLEGMASGKPCIAANEGGCKETIVHGKTGFLIKPQEDEIINTINRLDIKKVKTMKKYCLKWVQKFDTKICLKQWKKELNVLNS